MDINKGYKFYYTLYISPATNQSLYTLDTLVVNVPKEKADVKFMNDKFAYCLRYTNTDYISKDKRLLITVWFTNEIPVSGGPVNYFGLPGLVVWSEDFFRTSQLDKIEYIENNSKGFSFENEVKKYAQSFDKNKGGNSIKESIYLDMKAGLVESMRRAMR